MTEHNFHEAESLRQTLIRHFDGLLTLCWPAGMDAMYYASRRPVDKIREIAQKIGEPVQIAIKFDGEIGKTVSFYLPAATECVGTLGHSKIVNLGFGCGGYTQPISLSAQRLPSREEIDFQLLFSGAPFRDPMMIIDFGNVERPVVELGRDRIDYLSKVLQQPVSARIGSTEIQSMNTVSEPVRSGHLRHLSAAFGLVQPGNN